MSEKQKILHIVEAMGGGVFTYIVELVNGMSDEFDITIAFGVRSETPENYAEYFNDNVKLVRVKSFCRSLNPMKDLKACFELRKIVANEKPDIMHFHSSKAGAIGRMLFSRKNRKCFYTPHGYSFLMENISPIRRKIYKVIEKICGNRNCTTVACGKGEWEESQKVSKKTTYISNGINIEKIDKVLETPPLRSKGHPFTVYTVGRINYQKNPELFNEIAKLVPDVRFAWIGEGDMRDCLTSENIVITGWVKSQDALELSKNGDIFMLPSRWEGLPISLLEAMYMKKLSIVSNVVGNRDIVKNGITGYVCNTAEEFAETIMKYRDQDNSRVIENAYSEIVNHYNSHWLCDRYRELYSE